MKRLKVPVLIDYAPEPRRWRALLRKLQRGTWTRLELRWVLRHDHDMPLIVVAVVRQKLADMRLWDSSQS